MASTAMRTILIERVGLMITELRATFFLVVSFIFFLIIIGVLGLSTIMNPRRWSERLRSEG